MTPKTLHGRYVPTHPEKYRGDVNKIIFRSSWELNCCRKFDQSPIILGWASEPFGIPYYHPVKNRPAHYFPDFWIKYKANDGSIREALVEVKPESQTRPPKRKGKYWMDKMSTFAINESKWRAAKALCNQKGIEFMILTEKFISAL